MDLKNICINCMEEKEAVKVCPHCGYDQEAAPESLIHLPPGTILEDKYLLGKALGQGGFGITYIARDITLNIKLAIKEYLPQRLATRIIGQSTVSAYKTSLSDQFNYGLNKFLEEARTLANFIDNPNVVTVRDYFKANGTAYLVMNYHEGVNLNEFLEKRGGKITVDHALNLFNPLFDALKEIHATGILHRDISPDNLLVDNDDQVILIDFGSARQDVGERSRSYSVILKAGYSPVEQYQTKGKQGPWTDVYAVAATFYRSITAQKPPESIDRITEDLLMPPSHYGIEIESEKEEALLKALSLNVGDRFRNIEDFQVTLVKGEAAVSDDLLEEADKAAAESDQAQADQSETAGEKESEKPGFFAAFRWVNTFTSFLLQPRASAAEQTGPRRIFNTIALVLISIMMVLSGWVYLAGMSLERTMLGRPFYQGLAGDTDFITNIHQELENSLTVVIEESVFSELEREVGADLTEEEEQIIGNRLQDITLGLAEVFYEEWFEEQFLVISDDMLAFLQGEQQDLTAVIDLQEGKDRMQEQLIASLETLPPEMLVKFSIPADQIDPLVDRFMAEIDFPGQIKMADLTDNIRDSDFKRAEIATSFLQSARGIYRYLPYIIFAFLFICFIIVVGFSGALKWFGALTLFYSITFLGGILFFYRYYVPGLLAGIETETGLLLSLEPFLHTAVDYAALRIITFIVFCAVVGAIFLVAGMLSEKVVRNN